MTYKTIFNECQFNEEKVNERANEINDTPAYSLNGVYESLGIKDEDRNDIDLIIVGTFTPLEGRNKGMFYSTERNNVYRYLDNYFGNTCLQDLKDKFNEDPENNKKVSKKIAEYVIKNRIIFLDVMKKRADGSQESPSDKQISYFCCDRDSFKPYINRKKRFLITSRETEWLLKKIFNDLGANDEKIIYCPQIVHSLNFEGNNNRKPLIDFWRNTLNGILTQR